MTHTCLHDSKRQRLEGLGLSLGSGLLYLLSFSVQALIHPWVSYAQGVDLLFLPAGVKLLTCMVAGPWGLLGVALCAFITAFEVWQGESWLVHAGNIALWSGVPYITYLVLSRVWGLGGSLLTLRFWHVLAIALLTTLTSSVASNLYQWSLQNRPLPDLLSSSLAMTVGDFFGIGLVLLGLQLLLRRLSLKLRQP